MPRARSIFPVGLSLEACGKALGVPTRIIREAVFVHGTLPAWKAPSGNRVRVLVRDLEEHVRLHWPRATIARQIKRKGVEDGD